MHESVRLGDVERRLLPLLDGHTDRCHLVAALAEEAQAGRLVVQDQGRDVQDPARLETVLQEVVSDALQQTLSKALILPAA